MSKRRKRNWYAGLTLEQAERARRIQEEHIRAWYDEQARGAFGKPGSTWEIVDGRARLRGPNARELVVLNSTPSERVH
jgi:predicted transcriptional regulator